MSVQAEERFALAGNVDDVRLVIAWLSDIGERRNLALPAPAGSIHGTMIGALLDAVSREFTDYRDVVTGAREAARRNAEQLATIVRSTAEQGNMVRATAAASQEAGNRAEIMAVAAEALRGYAQAAAGSANEADNGLALIGGALGGLQGRLDDGKAPLAEMRRATNGVADFLVTLARLSRHAQLLAVNASIEAAHLAEAGSRFAIVAQEVRKLSTSTRESRADVARIVGELRESTTQVTSAADDSSDATSAAASEIERAGEALSQTGRGIAKFEEMVVTVADVAATQSMALQAISTSVEQIAHHADEAATASRDAGQLDLDTLLAQANTKAGRWTLRKAGSVPVSEHDDFSSWIFDLINGGDAAAPTDLERDERFATLVAAVRTLVTRVDAEQRDVLSDVVQVAVAVSRNGYAWRSIAQSLTGVSDEIGNVREMVSESTQGARQSAELASGMRNLVETMRSQYDGALASLEGALTRISRITSSVQEIDGFVESMNAAAARADQIMALIETLSSETDLLSLNAAIEAAHAGDLGRGFSVIAEEIRALARSTNDATVSVSQLVSSISGISGNLQSAIGAAAASTHDVTASAESVRGAIAQLRSAFESAMQHALEVSNAATGQTRALESVLENVNRAAAAFESNSTSSTDKGRLELAMLGSRAHAIAARRPIGTVIERVRTFGESLCEQLEAVIEAAIAGGRVSLDRLFDLQYRPIAGAEISSLSRLFDTSRVPAGGFDPPKYATPWDGAIDEAMIGVLESVYDAAAEFSPVTIFVSDLNGLFYAYPRRKIANWTNDFATDSAGNRIKRMFEDEYALRVGRWGLGPQASELGPRRTYDVFRQAGCTLSRSAKRPWAGFVYARDTSMVCNEVVLALYARDMRHSTLRICYDPNLI